MSIVFLPPSSGGAASIADATETTAGKIRIATSGEATTGTSDVIAMTPLTVKERIDAALVGGVEYKGDIAVSDFSTLLNAEKGDLYKISTGGTAGDGRVYAVGDSIIVNANMGGTFADSKLDKIDNTENITSVNGYSSGAINLGTNDLSDVTITGASTGEVLRYSGSAWVDAQLAYSDLSGTPTLATVATSGAYGDLSGTPTLATVATSGAYSDLSGTPTVPSALNDLSDVTITGASTGEVLRYSGSAWVDAQLAYGDLSGTPSLATVATSGAYGDLSGTPSLATVATSGAYSDLSGTPTLGTASAAATTDFLSATGADTLGGNLDVGSSDIVSSSNGSIDLAPDGTGLTTLRGNTTGGNNPGGLVINAETNLKSVTIKAPLDSGLTSYTLTLPNDDGSPDEVLKTDGNGVLSWTAQSGGGNQLAGTQTKNSSTFTASANYLYMCGYTSGTQEVTFPAASSATAGDIIGLSSNSATARPINIVSSDGTTNDLLDQTNTAKGGTSGALTLSIYKQVSWFGYNGTRWQELNAAPATVATSGAYSDLSGTPTLATVATSGAYGDLSGTPTVPSALNDLSDVTITGASTGEVLRYSGSAWVDAQLAYGDLSGTPTLATVATSGAYGDLSGTPSLATVATSGAYGDLSGTPTLGTASAAATTDFLSATGPDSLGGNLDVGSSDIVSSSNSSIDLAPDGTGLTTLRGNTTGGNNPGGLVINAETNLKSVTIKAPLDSGLTSYTLTLPNDDGSPDEVLKTDGNGVLSWTAQTGGGGSSKPTVTAVSPAVNYTLPTSTGIEEIFLITPGANIDVILISASTVGAGYKFQIKNLSATYSLTLKGPGSETIDGAIPATGIPIGSQYESLTLVSDNSNWFII